MEVFGELEKNTQAIYKENKPKTLLKTTHLGDAYNSSDSDDDYELHQSRLDAEQFELKDDLDITDRSLRLVSAIQKVKERIKLQQLTENEIKSQSETPNVSQNNTTQIAEKQYIIKESNKSIEHVTQTKNITRIMGVPPLTQNLTNTNSDVAHDISPESTIQNETQLNTQKITQSTQKIIQSTQMITESTQTITQTTSKLSQNMKVASEDKFDLKEPIIGEDNDNYNTIIPVQRKQFIIDSDNDEPDNETGLLTKLESTQAEYDNGTAKRNVILDNELNEAKVSTKEQPADTDDDEDDEAIIRPTRHRVPLPKENIETGDDDDAPIQPSADLASLFFSDDDNTADKASDIENDDISKKIDNYENLSKEQRYLARKIERSKIREEKRNIVDKSEINIQQSAGNIKVPSDSRNEKNNDVVVKEKKLKTHTILKKANEGIKIVTENEYSKDKLLEQLELDVDSEEESKSNLNKLLVDVNPEIRFNIKPVRNLMKKNDSLTSSTGIVELSESEYDDENDNFDPLADISMVQKTKKLDLSLKYSKKKKQKMEKVQKLSFTDKIQRMKANELKDKLGIKLSETKTSKITYTDAELAKMLLQDQLNNSSRAKKKRREKRRLEKQQQLLKEGKLTHDDDDPEFSSDYDISDESEDYRSGDEEDDKEVNDEGNIKDGVQQSAAGLFDTSGKLGEFNFTLSNMGEKVRTQDKSFDGLTSAEKFAKLKQIAEVEDHSENADSTTDIQPTFRNSRINEITIQSQSFNDTSNIQFHDILDSQNLILETQADGIEMSTQKLDHDSAVLSISTQKLDSFSLTDINNKDKDDSKTDTLGSTKINEMVGNEDHVDDDSDEDEDEKVQVGRKKKINSSDSEDVEVEEETVEELQKRAELIKLAKRKQREEARKREAEFKAKGLGDIVEKEAVESEDEFHGVGGGDRDFSDEENSEDEKMIDDALNANIGEDEIRKFHLDKELEEDQAKVAKTYRDIKTHELGKRRSKNSVFDVSDSEDDEMDEQRRMIEFIRKRRLREERELRATNDFKLDENDPKKAFYDEINIKLPSHVSIYKDSFTSSFTDLDTNDDDESIRNSDLKNYYNGIEDIQRPPLKKHKKSTLSETLDDDVMYGSFHDQETGRMKAEVLSDNTDDDDNDGSKILKLLKKKTSVKLTRKLVVPKPKAKEPTKDMDDSASFGLLTKTNSITSSFKKSTQKKIKISANTGNVIREINVTTSSKSVANSKAAVTGLSSSSSIEEKSSKRKLVRGSGLDRLDKMLAKSREKGIKSIGKR